MRTNDASVSAIINFIFVNNIVYVSSFVVFRDKWRHSAKNIKAGHINYIIDK